MALTSIFLSLSAGMLVIGVLNIFINVPFQVTLQETVPDGYRGRVFGLIDSMVQMLVPISMALSGVLLDRFSPASFFVTAGAFTVCIAVAMALSRSIKLLYSGEEVPSSEALLDL
jgi:MFS family permease